ncbi:MAG: class I SAM-dependent methyltransferase [Deltaproteobacteria bacterium]|jgi:2-polyprenyl-3-methyl-5-hydroxy-6-metoxy-1,4-benzoquinol methylase|nr:class I SAM-dependent methyltransferase [Deltaproteobacteria bacterium]
MTQLDQQKVERFAVRMADIVNGGALSLMISIGYETGLFEAMEKMAPASSEEIASEAGLNERYVREWLDAMVTGRVVDYSPESGTYVLPAEHAASLTLASGPDNMAVLAHSLPLLARVQADIVECFRKGGGVFYDQYPEYMALWAELNEQIFERTLISKVIPLVPGLRDRLAQGIDVLEIGCGEGHSLNLLASEYPTSRFRGYEFRENAVQQATAKARSLGSNNVQFKSQDITQLGESAAYDFIVCFDVIHDQAHHRTVLKNVADALRADGIFLMVDVRASSDVHENLEHPLAPFLYTTSTMHCMTVSLALDGEGLGTMWGERQARELLAEAGFRDVSVEHVEGDIFNNFYVARKG